MPALARKLRKSLLFTIVVLVGGGALLIFWNRPHRVDMASYVPAESVAFLEANDTAELANGLSGTEAWRALAVPLGAPERLISHPWLVSFARWSGIGSTESVLLARSQFALCVTQAQATESGSTLTIKPLAALIIETHTRQGRMQSTIERYVDQLARESYGSTVVVIQKQVNGADFREWSTADNSRRLVVSIVDTVAIIGNDESIVMACLDVHARKHKSIAEDSQFQSTRQTMTDARSAVFAYVPKAGVKLVIQAWALSRTSNSPDAASMAPLISNTFGNLIDRFAWTSRFDDAGAEDSCHVALAQDVTQQFSSLASAEPVSSLDHSLVPAGAVSVTSYTLKDPKSFWPQLNSVISSHSDVLGAIASRPLLQGLLEPYGIRDADRFFAAIGPRIQIIRLDQSAPAVLVAEAADSLALRKIAAERVGTNPKLEHTAQAEILTSATDDWSVAFIDKYFLSGPADEVRRCLEAKERGESIPNVAAFQRAKSVIDMSLPIFSLTFADDRTSAISVVEQFSKQERSAFSTNAAAIQQGAASLQYLASVTSIRNNSVEWTSRSSFGLVGTLLNMFAREKMP
ncbi:MAG TPA: hypothetical protein VN696_10905 [Pyrinomonadaceae bacterium]|nr:hypothetical protein [Pyrinomonadaceae bacterium]